MKALLSEFLANLKDFVRKNTNILILCTISIILVQEMGKGNSLTDIIVTILHIGGDVFMVMSLNARQENRKKIGWGYMMISGLFFLGVGWIAVDQGEYERNWQYLIGTAPFLVANVYHFLDAWSIRGKEWFAYQSTIMVGAVTWGIYIEFDWIYPHAWVQIIGMSAFPVFLTLSDNNPKVYIWRMISIGLMTAGVIIDIWIQWRISPSIPSASISTLFITLIALSGLSKLAPLYLQGEVQGKLTKSILQWIDKTQRRI
ncbi:MAG: hypothetical protein H6767_03200 [Candidatus Peribacteria bacterium]|nr:MAG: hypothetical protein H6767_03200 [Candidatus Peribacteria bacterium]